MNSDILKTNDDNLMSTFTTTNSTSNASSSLGFEKEVHEIPSNDLPSTVSRNNAVPSSTLSYPAVTNESVIFEKENDQDILNVSKSVYLFGTAIPSVTNSPVRIVSSTTHNTYSIGATVAKFPDITYSSNDNSPIRGSNNSGIEVKGGSNNSTIEVKKGGYQSATSIINASNVNNEKDSASESHLIINVQDQNPYRDDINLLDSNNNASYSYDIDSSSINGHCIHNAGMQTDVTANDTQDTQDLLKDIFGRDSVDDYSGRGELNLKSSNDILFREQSDIIDNSGTGISRLSTRDESLLARLSAREKDLSLDELDVMWD